MIDNDDNDNDYNFDDDMTLAEAREIMINLLPEGVDCPLCGQLAKLYRRKINSGMARALVTMYARAGTDWLHKPTVLRGVGAAARDESLLRYWGLAEEEIETRRDDGGRAGWWRVTDKGAAFIHGLITVQEYALVYDAHCRGFMGDPVNIHDALGAKFRLDELMAGI